MRVGLVTTGGTIANGPDGRLTPDDLVRSLPPGSRAGLDVVPVAFANDASAALSLDDWRRLSLRVRALLSADPTLAGIVVTGGTDTLEELAFFLHLTIPGPRPVVVVGAMRRPGSRGADGPRNLRDALRVAAAPASRGRGTLVVMHGQVHASLEARKTHSTRLGAFDASPAARLGTVEGTVVRYAHPPAPRPRPGCLALEGGDVLPRVDVLLTYQGAEGDLESAAVNAGARGVVLASAGAGALTPSQLRAAERLAGRGIPVVLGTRTGAGPVAQPEGRAEGVILAGIVPPLKARLLLMLAIARRLDRDRLVALFDDVSR